MKTYFLSWWIENLGVVPLFLFAAFLFLPIFLSLSFLLHSVCIVLDAITLSLFINSLYISKSRQIFLYVLLVIVKGFSLNYAHAQSVTDKNDRTFQHFLSKGEQLELKFSNLDNFSVGNPQVISVKYRPQKSSFLIKGISMGFSDLIIWKKNQKITHNLYIISKQEQLKRAEILQGLHKMGLHTDVIAGIICVKGTIKSIIDYKNIIKIKKHVANLSLNINLDLSLRNFIIGDIYKSLYKKGPNLIRCTNKSLLFSCVYQGILPNEITNELKDSYEINFIRSNKSATQNFYIDLKIVQVENVHSKQIDLGIDQISASIEKVINLNQLVLNENIHISQESFNATIIANPKGLVRADEEFQLTLGSEIPFSQTSNNGVDTSWKFAGLNFNAVIKEVTNGLLLNYSTNFTNSMNQNVEGATGKGSIYIKSEEYIRIFEITSNVKKQNTISIPLLNKIPFINYLFQNNSNINGHKQIIGFAKIRRSK